MGALRLIDAAVFFVCVLATGVLVRERSEEAQGESMLRRDLELEPVSGVCARRSWGALANRPRVARSCHARGGRNLDPGGGGRAVA